MLLFSGATGKAQKERNREVSAARADGLPTEPSDLDRLIAVPESQNAAPLYAKAFALMGTGKPLEKPLRAMGAAVASSPKPTDIATAKEAYPKVASLLELAHQIGKYPHVNFHRDWSKGFMLLFPEFANQKALARGLAYEAQQRSAKGDWKGALQSLRDAQQIGLHAGEDPILIGLLVRISIEAIVHATFRKIANEHSHDPAFVAAALDFSRHMGPLPDLKRALKGELVLGRTGLSHVKSLRDIEGSAGESSSSKASESVFQSPLVQATLDGKLVRAYRELITSMPDDPAQWETANERSKAFDERNEADHSLGNSLNRIIFPVFGQAATAVGGTIMQRRLTETSLLLLQERAKTGHFPDRLPNYGPVRIDPFSGAPLVYQRTAEGFTLYSVGRDGEDNGGQSRDTRHSDRNYDEVVRFK